MNRTPVSPLGRVLISRHTSDPAAWPGWLTIAGGLTLLGKEVKWAQRTLEWG